MNKLIELSYEQKTALDNQYLEPINFWIEGNKVTGYVWNIDGKKIIVRWLDVYGKWYRVD